MQEQKKMKYLKVNFNMIESDKQFYLKHCNFNELEENIFLDLTGKKPMSGVQIAMKEHTSERNVSKTIRQIKLKMIKSIIFQ